MFLWNFFVILCYPVFVFFPGPIREEQCELKITRLMALGFDDVSTL